MDERFELTISSSEYPEQLRCLTDAPETLYCMGDLTLLRPGVAIVGARRATPYGLSAARLFSSYCARIGEPVISGAAIGCDQEAHRAALAADGGTVAVLACGADLDYPSGARHLLARIRRSGLVVSEMPWGTPPARWRFARRNRIIATLAHSVLVVEASLPSGTFGTADCALDHGRDVYAVPGSIFAPECRGSNRLIRQGACPITDVSELGDALGVTDHGCSETLALDGAHADDPVARALLSDPMRPDDLSRALGMHVVEVVRRIGILESYGMIRRYPDGRYGPCVDMPGALQSTNGRLPPAIP